MIFNKYDSATKFLQMLASDQELAFDVETNGLKWQKTHVCGYSLSDGKEYTYVPVRHEGGANINNVEQFEKETNEIISKRKKKLIGQNVKI